MSKFSLILAFLGLLLATDPGSRARGEDVPATARRLLEEYDKQTKEIKRKAEADLKQSRKKLLESLEALETSFKKEAKFGQAQAVTRMIQEIKEGPIKSQANPGTLSAVVGQPGKVSYFEMTGGNAGTVWGTDVYTDDSSLASAAVHAGVLTLGQKGVVKVTLLAGQQAYQGSTPTVSPQTTGTPFTAVSRSRQPANNRLGPGRSRAAAAPCEDVPRRKRNQETESG